MDMHLIHFLNYLTCVFSKKISNMWVQCEYSRPRLGNKRCALVHRLGIFYLFKNFWTPFQGLGELNID
jgi:hypothetical protein